MPLSAADNEGFAGGLSALGPAGSFGLNRELPASEAGTVRSGTSLRFASVFAELFVGSSRGALSADLAAVGFDDGFVAVVEAEVDFFAVFDEPEDRRLKRERG